MKKILFALFALAVSISASAQSRIDAEGNTVNHPLFVVAQYQLGDFDLAKETGYYGIGLYASSISHWGKFHVGADLCYGLNAGIVHDWGCIIDFGPSVRYDLTDSFFVNMPVNAVCVVTIPEGEDTRYDWGARIAPSIHGIIANRFGVFVGPQVSFSFEDGISTSFGMQAGLTYSF